MNENIQPNDVSIARFVSFVISVFGIVLGVVIYLLVSEPVLQTTPYDDSYVLRDYTMTYDTALQKDPGFKIVSPIKEYYSFEYPSLLNGDWCFYVKEETLDLDNLDNILTFEEI